MRPLLASCLILLPALAYSAAWAEENAATSAPAYSPSERGHWSFVPPVRPAIPRFADATDQAWVQSPVDAFILAGLQDKELSPAPPADRAALLRRVTWDLTGLPPTPEEVAAFAADDSPVAWERTVERLLSSPRYGERWGQHWLDVVRYAETEGFEYDRLRPGAWRYRDYVIVAWNEDKPYDRFLWEQLAGDELATAGGAVEGVPALSAEEVVQARIAAGFHRLGPVRRNAGNADVSFSRNEVLTQMTDAVGSALLGVTLGCARCHDHMFDGIRQKDYYRMQAFLADTFEQDLPLATAAEAAQWKKATDKITAQMAQVKEELDAAPETSRPPLEQRLKDLEARLPPPLDSVSTVQQRGADRTEIHVLYRGQPEKPGETVGPRPLGVLLPEGAAEWPADVDHPKTRVALWLTGPHHPLTARVIVNRLWQYHFGRGLVPTANDFGANGEAPSHPQLLDFLATELVRGGWRIKPIQRMILASSVYQQASQAPRAAQAAKVDPENRRLWHFPRRRLSAEEIRDGMLAISGRLNEKLTGPSVILPVEPELVKLLYKPSQWEVTSDLREHDRRSIYLLAKRNLRLPFMEVFDQPDLQTSCWRRETSTHAPQALELLGGAISNELAAALAQRLAREAGSDRARQVELAYLLTAGRRPSAREDALALEFLASQPLSEFALAMFNLNAYLYVE